MTVVGLGIALGLTASVAWGVANLFAAIVGRRIGSLWSVASWQVVSIAALVVVAVATDTPISPFDPQMVPAYALGILAAATFLAYFTALRLGPVSVVSAVVALNGGLSAALAVVLLGEPLTPWQAAGIVVGSVGALLCAVRFVGGERPTELAGPGVVFGVGALVGFALLTIGYVGPIHDVGPLPAVLASRFGNGAAILAVLLALRATSRLTTLPAAELRDRRLVTLIVLGGISSALGFVAYGSGLHLAPAWLIGLTSSFAPAVLVLAGIGLFRERLTAVQAAGVLLAIAGVVLIGLGPAG